MYSDFANLCAYENTPLCLDGRNGIMVLEVWESVSTWRRLTIPVHLVAGFRAPRDSTFVHLRRSILHTPVGVLPRETRSLLGTFQVCYRSPATVAQSTTRLVGVMFKTTCSWSVHIENARVSCHDYVIVVGSCQIP